jgi:hypothetical protein
MLDDKTKALIIKYLRKAWLYSPARRQVIKAAETGEKTLDGEKTYWCNYKNFFNHKVSKVYPDHIRPMISLEGFDSWDALINRLFDVENMQAICKAHHSEKTKEENKQRKKKVKK